MDVIAHQHKRVNGDPAPAAGVAQQAQVMTPIFVVDEQRSTIDAALYDMKRDAGENQAGRAGHGRLR
jgi:hypothetical protein